MYRITCTPFAPLSLHFYTHSNERTSRSSNDPKRSPQSHIPTFTRTLLLALSALWKQPPKQTWPSKTLPLLLVVRFGITKAATSEFARDKEHSNCVCPQPERGVEIADGEQVLLRR
jgi:hypothetical protein